jgi:CRISPR-associated protein Cmr4
MFEATRMLFIYVETPLHAGTGRGLGAVDLPIQRERTTNYPIVQASSIKGRLRGEAYAKDPQFQQRFAALKSQYEAQIPRDEKDKERAKSEATKRARREAAKEAGLEAIFGPETGENASEHAGALSAGDARILLFPVRSLAGVFTWVTSMDALARFQREAAMVGLSLSWKDLPAPGKEDAWVNGDKLKAGESVVLEEFSFTPKPDHSATIKAIGEWLAAHALPPSEEYKYWRDALPQKLCILHEDAFRDFVLYGTEVQTHIKLNPSTKTVDGSALWTSESLPVDTLLYAPLMATKSRAKNGVDFDAERVLKKIDDLKLTRTQLGGDETTGQGIVSLCIARGNK